MKKSFVLMAMAGVALASCVNDEVADVVQNEQQGQKITFSSPVMYDNNVGSRANVHGMIGDVINGNKVYPTTENFQIYAVKHEGNFAGWTAGTAAAFDNTAISYDSSLDGWVPKSSDTEDPYYYWPSGYMMSFAACSPADLQQATEWNGRSYTDAGLTLTDFVVPRDAAQQFDLMFSCREVNKTKNDMNHSADYYSGIPLKFNHALTAIRFSLKSDASATVTLKKISLYGVAEKGTFTENISYDDGNYAKYVIDENVNPTWTISTGAELVPYGTDGESAYVAFNGNLDFPEEAQYISDLLAKESATNTSSNHILLLLPQTLTDEAYLKVDYTVTGGSNSTEAHKIVKLKSALLLDDESNEVTSEALTTWEMGTRYTYRLYYSDKAAKKDKIFFSPRVEGWKDAGVAVIDLASE